MFCAGRFTSSQSSPPVRKATYLLTFYFRIYSSMFFCCSIYIETAQNSREECNEFADLLFWKPSIRLPRDSLSCDTRSLDLCIFSSLYFYTSDIFCPNSCEPACSAQVDLHRASPHLPWGRQRICWPFILEFIPACFFAARFTLRQPKTPVRNAMNLRTFCFENHQYAFQETLCPVTLAH